MIDTYFSEVQEVCSRMDVAAVDALINVLYEAYEQGRHVFLFGNGGSAANASHFCEDVAKGTLASMEAEKRIKAISLTDNVPYITAWANDEGYDRIFEQQLVNLCEAGDVTIAISGSGNSPNVLRATEYADAHSLFTVGMTGYDGGKLGKMVKLNVHVPSFNMGLVEGVHGMIIHYVVQTLSERICGAEDRGIGSVPHPLMDTEAPCVASSQSVRGLSARSG